MIRYLINKILYWILVPAMLADLALFSLTKRYYLWSLRRRKGATSISKLKDRYQHIVDLPDERLATDMQRHVAPAVKECLRTFISDLDELQASEERAPADPAKYGAVCLQK